MALLIRELLNSVLAQAGFVGDQAITMREKTSKAQHQDWDFGFCTSNIPLGSSVQVYFAMYSCTVYILLWSLMGVVPGRSEMKLSITKQSTQKVSLGSEIELFHLVPQFYANCLCIVALVSPCYKIVVTRCYKIVVTRCAQRWANASSL